MTIQLYYFILSSNATSTYKNFNYFPFQPGSPVLRVLQFSDIHLDHLYKEGSNPDCGEPLCCRSTDGTPGMCVSIFLNQS